MHGNRKLPRSICEEVAHLELQLQVLEIIDEILSGTAACEADARSSLRWYVSANPGQPQRALLMHMMSIQRSDHT
ncbi:hypothetical protein AB0P28_03330 [Pseudarthrobacter sp. NPDC089323]|jgi:hypothetical protein